VFDPDLDLGMTDIL